MIHSSKYKNYFKIAIRNIKSNIAFSMINIFGLTFGLSIASLVILYVSNDLSYDKYHIDSNRIYRLYREVKIRGMVLSGAKVSSLMGPYLSETYPYVESQTRVSGEHDLKILYNGNVFDETMHFVDSTFFEIFTLETINGDISTALRNPFSLVLDKKTANKIFGQENPVGKAIRSVDDNIYTIGAVVRNVPENSHFKFHILCSFSTKKTLNNTSNDAWGFKHESFSTYIKLKKNVPPEKLKAKFPSIIEKYLQDGSGAEYSYDLQPMEDIYLYHDGGGDINRIILFSIIGIFVLIIACINYINLNTAGSINRMKEIGVRKVIGASRKELKFQLLTESILISFISMILGLFLAEILLPGFNTILQKDLSFDYFNNWPLTLFFIGLALITGFLAGTYPAFYLSSIKPINSLKGKFLFSSLNSRVRNVLVILQFTITIFLLICTGIIYMQIRHATRSELGFSYENVMILSLSKKSINNTQPTPEEMRSTSQMIKNELQKIPEVSDVSISATFPYGNTSYGKYYFNDIDQEKIMVVYHVDSAFIDLLKLEIVEGRAFSGSNATEENKVLVNQTMVKKMDYDNPIGESFLEKETNTNLNIIGVVKDFHKGSLHEAIPPMILKYAKKFPFYCSLGLKINSGNIMDVSKKVEKAFEKYTDKYVIEPWFLSQKIAKKYTKEVNTARMFASFAIGAIIIACMGLYGLALFMIRRKSKEIIIRRIFGSSTTDIIINLTKKFIGLIIIAAIVAIPVAWYYLDIWLQSFVYQVGNRWLVFVMSTLIALLIAFITIFYHSLRVANQNISDKIRYE